MLLALEEVEIWTIGNLHGIIVSGTFDQNSLRGCCAIAYMQTMVCQMYFLDF